MASISRFQFRTFLMAILFAASASLQSCNNDDPAPVAVGKDGFFIVNEGTFNANNASLSYYDRQANDVTNYVFKAKNGIDLGDQAQSMTIFENKGYIVVQNDGKIEIINPEDFSSLGTISGFSSPRYFAGISSTKAYVSDWGADGVTGTIQVIDLTTNQVKKAIPTGRGANRMLKVNNLVYVANAGGWGRDNTIKIIDSNTDAVTATITVGDNPNSLVRDADGNIWVTSGGHTAYNPDFSVDEANSTKASLSKITTGNTEAFRLETDAITYPSMGNLSVSPNGKTLFYTYNGSVYKMSTSATSLPTTAFKTKNYYSLTVDPFNGNVLGGEAPNFTSAGNLDILNSETGEMIETFQVGISPIGYAFK